MPHQCLQCGYSFEEGSSALLAGCPECKGTRFFYSRSPVDVEERKRIAKEQGQDEIQQVVQQLLLDAAPETAKELEAQADEEGWAQLTTKDLRKLVKKVRAEQARKPRPTNVTSEPVDSAARRAQVEAARSLMAEELANREEDPQTLNVGDGRYELDLQGLMKRDPVVIHKDGAYVIHLPSLFQKRLEK